MASGKAGHHGPSRHSAVSRTTAIPALLSEFMDDLDDGAFMGDVDILVPSDKLIHVNFFNKFEDDFNDTDLGRAPAAGQKPA